MKRYDKPLVSVIITTRNEESVIRRLLESVKKQSYLNIEIIVVDNYSNDSTVKIAKKFTKMVFQKGPERSAQRNFGADKSSGDYLLFLDADMELGNGVVFSCVETVMKHHFEAIIVPEETVGKNIIAKIRNFERQMYKHDASIEVARFYKKSIFNKLVGFDTNLTGAEDYDLHKRASLVGSIGWSKEYLYHHEENQTLGKLLKKKYYYASKSALYSKKHPDLVASQGTIIFRKAYLRHWKNFITHPLLGVSFICVRLLETVYAVAGFIKAVGFKNFLNTALQLFKRQ